MCCPPLRGRRADTRTPTRAHTGELRRASGRLDPGLPTRLHPVRFYCMTKACRNRSQHHAPSPWQDMLPRTRQVHGGRHVSACPVPASPPPRSDRVPRHLAQHHAACHTANARQGAAAVQGSTRDAAAHRNTSGSVYAMQCCTPYDAKIPVPIIIAPPSIFLVHHLFPWW